jgi:hypothetical protein
MKLSETSASKLELKVCFAGARLLWSGECPNRFLLQFQTFSSLKILPTTIDADAVKNSEKGADMMLTAAMAVLFAASA